MAGTPPGRRAAQPPPRPGNSAAPGAAPSPGRAPAPPRPGAAVLRAPCKEEEEEKTAAPGPARGLPPVLPAGRRRNSGNYGKFKLGEARGGPAPRSPEP